MSSRATRPSTIALIQARMSSSRLPGKVLMPLGEGRVLDHVVRRSASIADRVVVCTSTASSDDAIAEHCELRKYGLYRGSLDDVFARFQDALRDVADDCEWFVRVTADCPLVSPVLAECLFDEMSPDLDYLGIDATTAPRGLAVELIRTRTFLTLDREKLDPAEREHVTLHLYENPTRFGVRWVSAPPELAHPEYRLTLDYEEDYELLTALFDRDDNLSALDAIERLRNDPQLASLNAHCAQRSAR